MAGLIVIFIFVVLLAVPGFYLITRKVFPKKSKRSVMWITLILTTLLVVALAWGLAVNLPA